MKRITITIDLTEVTDQVGQLVDSFSDQLQYTVADYDPNFKFNVNVEEVKD